jgi:single-strand DNA-binding protein
MSYNKAILVGRLTADPALTFTPSGVAVAKFTLAVNRAFSKEKEVDFIDHVAWRGLAETVANHLKKGSLVVTDGRLQIRSYEDREGVRRKAAEIVCENVRFLDRGKDSGSQQGGSQGQRGTDEFSEVPFNDDDLPFSLSLHSA